MLGIFFARHTTKTNMYHFIKPLLFTFILGFASTTAFSQSDSAQINRESGKIKGGLPLKIKAVKPKGKPASNIDLKIKKKVAVKKIQENIKKHSATAQKYPFLLETLPKDRDIVGKKYWKGKDVTHQKLKSTVSLGTVNSKSKIVKIECRDHSYVDGDRIRIYVNEKPVSNNIGLKGNYYVLYVNLERGYNKIDFQALNQGLSGPNTAEVNLYDEKGNLLTSKEWNIATGEIATLGVLKY